MIICPNCCLENHNDKNFDNYCDDCYQEIYLDFNEDPNNDDDYVRPKY